MIMTAGKAGSPVPAVLYRVDEAADALRLSRSALYELIRSGRLRSVKSGRRRWSRSRLWPNMWRRWRRPHDEARAG
jgi:excisionase family DNA binding protein